MKNIIITIIALFSIIGSTTGANNNATQARKVLDKVASTVSSKGGASANFTISSPKLKSSGTISIKGNRFCARTPEAIMWYNGKTQWTYMKQNDEVNVSTPNPKNQAMMNPLHFINLYKKGYAMTMKTEGKKHEVHLTATDKSQKIEEMYITVDKSSNIPTQVRMRQGKQWTSISISNFTTKALSDNTFVFNAKEFPSAEVIDLR